jgi:hypothetical protein
MKPTGVRVFECMEQPGEEVAAFSAMSRIMIFFSV